MESKLQKTEKKRLKGGIVFQNSDHQIIFPTVGEELRFGLTQLGLSKNEADFKVNACLKEYNKLEWFDDPFLPYLKGRNTWFVCYQFY